MSSLPMKTGATGSLKLVVAGGGSGGHLFPGIAVAEAFCESDPKTRVLFVNAGKPFEIETLKRLNWPHRIITIEGINGVGRGKQLRAGLKIPKSVWESVRILREFNPDLVFGVGGYSSGPVMVAAALLGIKAVLHEQNRIPGITNRILARFADRICVSFSGALEAGPLSKGKYREKVRVTGNPIRRDFLRDMEMPDQDAALQKEKASICVLIIGGSQGAHAINRAMMEAAVHFKRTDSIRIVHQTGPKDRSEVERVYRRRSISGTVRPFFHDMARRYRGADLLVCRAGATTIAEITAIGKAAIFIPFPYAADDHQMFNARALADAGAAELISEKDLTGKKLAERIDFFLERPELAVKMAARAKHFGKPDAADRIVNECRMLLLNGNRKGRTCP